MTSSASADECPNGALHQGSTELPDCRGYELVSPPSKDGADIIPNSFKTFAAADGNGVAFAGLGAFGGDVRGTAVDVQYLARRTGDPGTSGWTTRSVNPPGGASTLIGLISGIAPGFNAFSDDLTRGVWTAAKLVAPAPNVGGVPNVYRLRSLEGDAPQAELMSASASALQKPPFPDDLTFVNFFAGASSDLSHVIFQSPYNLTGDASYSPAGDLYESVEGVGLRRVGRIPSGSDMECDDVAGPARPIRAEAATRPSEQVTPFGQIAVRVVGPTTPRRCFPLSAQGYSSTPESGKATNSSVARGWWWA
jgi:hypothetical protein